MTDSRVQQKHNSKLRTIVQAATIFDQPRCRGVRPRGVASKTLLTVPFSWVGNISSTLPGTLSLLERREVPSATTATATTTTATTATAGKGTCGVLLGSSTPSASCSCLISSRTPPPLLLLPLLLLLDELFLAVRFRNRMKMFRNRMKK